MFYKNEIKRLNEIVQKQEKQITELENRLNEYNNELIVIGEELFLTSRNGYPSFYDIKQKLMENGTVKKTNIFFVANRIENL
jgi:hypothetical protein